MCARQLANLRRELVGCRYRVSCGHCWRVAGPGHARAYSELHALLHDQLHLETAQHAKLDTLEQQFAVRRKARELEMRADNARLAAAIEAEHGFAMRGLLRPDQTAKFDGAVVKALTGDQK